VTAKRATIRKVVRLLTVGLVAITSSGCGRVHFQSVADASVAAPDAPAFAPDPGFGSNGVVVVDVGGVNNLSYSIHGIAVQPDGKIVVGGDAGTVANSDMLVARFLDDGTPDPMFGAAGLVTIDVFPTDGTRSVALQPDGKIIVSGGGGSALPDSELVRLLPTGALDPSFGTASPGVTTVTFPGDRNSPNAAFVGVDGKIVFGGQAHSATQGWDLVTARFDAAGALDPTFGNAGIVDTDLSNSDEFGSPAAILPDGRIYLGASTYLGAPSFAGAVVRLATDGTPDVTFGSGGHALIQLATRTVYTEGLVLDPQGRIVVVGVTGDSPATDAFVTRLRADGSPDPTFHGGSAVVVDLGGDEQFMNALVLPDGRIVAAGRSNHRGNDDIMLAVLHDDGSLDTSVGSGGVVEIDPVPGQDSQAWGLALDQNGRVLVLASTSAGSQNDIVILRLER